MVRTLIFGMITGVEWFYLNITTFLLTQGNFLPLLSMTIFQMAVGTFLLNYNWSFQFTLFGESSNYPFGAMSRFPSLEAY
jgi:hypothetical protein